MHTFIHTFSNEGIVVLRVDLSTNPPTMAQMPREVTKKQQVEYREWLNEVVAPGIVRLCDEEQLATCAEKGLEILEDNP